MSDWLLGLVLPLTLGVGFMVGLNTVLHCIGLVLRARRDAEALAAKFRDMRRSRTTSRGLFSTEFDVKRARDWLFVRACQQHADLCVAVKVRHVTVVLRSEKPPEGLLL